MKTILGEGGRLVIPAAYRKALDLKPGDTLLVRLENGELKITSLRESIARAQALVRQYIPKGRMLSEELIQERREEAACE